MDNQEQINQLLNKLQTLLKRQDDFYGEINNLRIEINRFKTITTEQETKKEDIKQEGLRPMRDLKSKMSV
jgi:hypothetical protein